MGRFDHLVRDDHVAPYGQAVHEAGVVRERHLLRIDRPCAVARQHLAVIGVRIGGPVLGVDEVGAFEGLALGLFDARRAHELRVQFVPFGVGDDEIVVRGVHPLGERVVAGSLSGKFNGISYQIIFNLTTKVRDNFEISRERMKM